jgi:hypothetical protein
MRQEGGGELVPAASACRQRARDEPIRGQWMAHTAMLLVTLHGIRRSIELNRVPKRHGACSVPVQTCATK